MTYVLFFLYLAAGYWAAGETIFKNRIIIEYKFGDAFVQRMIFGAVLGWILIPVAILKRAFGH